MSEPDQSFLSSIEEIVEEARQGRMFILVDREDRENEGDLVIPAQWVTAETINFMARYGRGLICLAMERQRCEQLQLPLMSQHNASRHQTAFTVSIEAREGIETGISAADRARTVQVAINAESKPEDLVSPGHVFPLVAKDGGVLVRAGHTEAAVDIARLAGLHPSGVICEVMNDDGTMARLPDLIRFAQFHGLKVATIADLIAHRRRTETLVECKMQTTLRSKFGGDWQLYVYVNKVSYAEHVALVKGDISGAEPVLVRMHAMNVLEDVLGDVSGGRSGDLQRAMRLIGEEGRGIVCLIREPRPDSLSERLSARDSGTPLASGGPELREYGVGAQILNGLGVREIIILTNSKKQIIGLEGYGLTAVDQRPLPDDGAVAGSL